MRLRPFTTQSWQLCLRCHHHWLHRLLPRRDHRPLRLGQREQIGPKRSEPDHSSLLPAEVSYTSWPPHQPSCCLTVRRAWGSSCNPTPPSHVPHTPGCLCTPLVSEELLLLPL